LSDHAEHCHHDPTGLAARRDVAIEHGRERLALIALMNDVQHVAGVAPEPVKAGHHQFVAGPQKVDMAVRLGGL
jgi:hypothetical protein